MIIDRAEVIVTSPDRNFVTLKLTTDENLADEFGPEGISTAVVHPGATRTEAWAERAAAGGASIEAAEAAASRNALHRPIDATEVADVITFLASPRSEAINGDAVAVGGGMPGFVSY